MASHAILLTAASARIAPPSPPISTCWAQGTADGKCGDPCKVYAPIPQRPVNSSEGDDIILPGRSRGLSNICPNEDCDAALPKANLNYRCADQGCYCIHDVIALCDAHPTCNAIMYNTKKCLFFPKHNFCPHKPQVEGWHRYTEPEYGRDTWEFYWSQLKKSCLDHPLKPCQTRFGSIYGYSADDYSTGYPYGLSESCFTYGSWRSPAGAECESTGPAIMLVVFPALYLTLRAWSGSAFSKNVMSWEKQLLNVVGLGCLWELNMLGTILFRAVLTAVVSLVFGVVGLTICMIVAAVMAISWFRRTQMSKEQAVEVTPANPGTLAGESEQFVDPKD